MDSKSRSRAREKETEMNSLGGAIATDSSGLSCRVEEIKPTEVDGVILFSGADFESKEDKIEEARDHIAGWGVPQARECFPSDTLSNTEEMYRSGGLPDLSR